MTNNTTSAGRPSNVGIRGDLVRRRRKELGWSQTELVEKVYAAMGKCPVLDQDSLERPCRRWEADNTISAPALRALADVVDRGAKYLQEGGAPGPAPDRVKEIRQRLKEQVKVGNPAALAFVRAVRRLEQLGNI